MMRQAIRTSEARLYKPIAHDDSCAGTTKKEMKISETPTFDAWTFSNIK